MKRRLFRVPLDFAHPTEKDWPGYVDPFYAMRIPCEACPDNYNRGYSREALLLQDLFDEEPDQSWLPSYVNFVPVTEKNKALLNDIKANPAAWIGWRHKLTAEEQEIVVGRQDPDSRHLTEVRLKRFGVYPYCTGCKGHTFTWPPGVEEKHNAWVETDPPLGDGFQLWADNAPWSPVFSTLDDVCAWAAENATTFADFKAPAEEWKAMLEAGHVFYRNGNMVHMGT